MCSCQAAQGSLPGTVKQRRRYAAHPRWSPPLSDCPCGLPSLHHRFEDRDFLGELNKPPAERRTPCEQLLRDEAIEVWKEYGQLVTAGEVQHY